MRLQMLMLSHDAALVSAFQRTSDESGIELQLCEEAASARAALKQRKYDAVLIDCDDTHAGPAVLKGVRQSLPNRTSLVVAILNGDLHQADAQDMGAHVVLHKPISLDRARLELRNLRGLTGQDQRRSPRYSLKTPVYVSCGRTIDRRAETFNLALGGMGIRLADRLEEDDILRLRFQLPGTAAMIQARGEIAWADPEGRVGIRFVSMPDSTRAEVEKWLTLRAMAGGS